MASNNENEEQVSSNLANLVEPADAKTRARTVAKRRPPQIEAPPIHAEIDNSIIRKLIAARSIGHAPIAPRLDFVITYAELGVYFGQLYDDLILLIFPGNAPQDLITRANFINVCNYLVCMRVQHVRRVVLNIQPTHGVVANRPNMLVPTALARVLRGLGTALKLNSAVEVFPIVPEHVAFTAQQREVLRDEPLSERAGAILAALAAHPGEAVKMIEEPVINQFTRFTVLMHRRGANYVVEIGNDVVAEHPWYIHGVLDRRDHVAADSPQAIIVTFDPQPSRDELLMAAIIQRGFDGQLNNGPGILVESDPIMNIFGVRALFNTAC